jgi:phage tail protein X
VGKLLLGSMAPNASIAPWFTWDYARQDAMISTLYEKAQGIATVGDVQEFALAMTTNGLSVVLAEAHVAEVISNS